MRRRDELNRDVLVKPPINEFRVVKHRKDFAATISASSRPYIRPYAMIDGDWGRMPPLLPNRPVDILGVATPLEQAALLRTWLHSER